MPETTIDYATIKDWPLDRIAEVAFATWPKPYFGAVPYLQAMQALDSIDDHYGMEDGHTIVAYFLSNARTWRGPDARAIKAELKRRCRWTR